MELTHAQKQAFYDQGYVQVPGVVPRVMVDAALKAINHSVGEGIPTDQVVTMRSRSYCTELQREPVITDLLNKTPAWSLAESLIGPGKIRPVDSGQIALRFPGTQDPPNRPRAHLDGMHSPHNGVPEGTIQNFTMLVGVLLSDLHQPYSGNFTVWPGTHHCYERYFQEHTPQSLLDGMPPIEMPEPVQIQGKAGDVVLVHYELAHSAAPNVSPHVRYAIFFRLTHVDHEEHKWEAMTDIWLEYEGMRAWSNPAEDLAATRPGG
ncbi:MAG TPA: phytanoyl-CoA dioxygenase family protein [Chthonomonadaceae bacterium]|nr:phytanoyl-CoA dioxygenase family protein [Chthonomonadaceae bacterium]